MTRACKILCKARLQWALFILGIALSSCGPVQRYDARMPGLNASPDVATNTGGSVSMAPPFSTDYQELGYTIQGHKDIHERQRQTMSHADDQALAQSIESVFVLRINDKSHIYKSRIDALFSIKDTAGNSKKLQFTNEIKNDKDVQSTYAFGDPKAPVRYALSGTCLDNTCETMELWLYKYECESNSQLKCKRKLRAKAGLVHSVQHLIIDAASEEPLIVGAGTDDEEVLDSSYVFAQKIDGQKAHKTNTVVTYGPSFSEVRINMEDEKETIRFRTPMVNTSYFAIPIEDAEYKGQKVAPGVFTLQGNDPEKGETIVDIDASLFTPVATKPKQQNADTPSESPVLLGSSVSLKLISEETLKAQKQREIERQAQREAAAQKAKLDAEARQRAKEAADKKKAQEREKEITTPAPPLAPLPVPRPDRQDHSSQSDDQPADKDTTSKPTSPVEEPSKPAKDSKDPGGSSTDNQSADQQDSQAKHTFGSTLEHFNFIIPVNTSNPELANTRRFHYLFNEMYSSAHPYVGRMIKMMQNKEYFSRCENRRDEKTASQLTANLHRRAKNNFANIQRLVPALYAATQPLDVTPEFAYLLLPESNYANFEPEKNCSYDFYSGENECFVSEANQPTSKNKKSSALGPMQMIKGTWNWLISPTFPHSPLIGQSGLTLLPAQYSKESPITEAKKLSEQRNFFFESAIVGGLYFKYLFEDFFPYDPGLSLLGFRAGQGHAGGRSACATLKNETHRTICVNYQDKIFDLTTAVQLFVTQGKKIEEVNLPVKRGTKIVAKNRDGVKKLFDRLNELQDMCSSDKNKKDCIGFIHTKLAPVRHSPHFRRSLTEIDEFQMTSCEYMDWVYKVLALREIGRQPTTYGFAPPRYELRIEGAENPELLDKLISPENRNKVELDPLVSAEI